MKRPAFGTAHADVLLKLTSPHRAQPTWSLQDGTSLYESRAFTDILCQGLVRHGYLDEEFDGKHSTYTVNLEGRYKAAELRDRL